MDDVADLRRQLRATRRWVAGLSVATALLALASLRTAIGPAAAQPAPAPAPKSLTFVDGDSRVDLDASGLRIARGASHVAVAADKLTATAGDATVELAATAADAHVKALSEMGSTSLVANAKSLCFAIRQIGGKDSYTCLPPGK